MYLFIAPLSRFYYPETRRFINAFYYYYYYYDWLHIYPMRGIFYIPWHRYQIEGTNGFQCFFQKTLPKSGKGNCQSFQAVPVGFEPATTRSSVERSNHSATAVSKHSKITGHWSDQLVTADWSEIQWSVSWCCWLQFFDGEESFQNPAGGHLLCIGRHQVRTALTHVYISERVGHGQHWMNGVNNANLVKVFLQTSTHCFENVALLKNTSILGIIL